MRSSFCMSESFVQFVGFVPPPSNALKMSPELHEPDNLRTFVPSPIGFLQFISRDCAVRLLEIQSSGFERTPFSDVNAYR